LAPKSHKGGVDVSVFSGHDVNILALLHALDASIVRNNIAPTNDGVCVLPSHWPDYGAFMKWC
jgi:hypothetical protein